MRNLGQKTGIKDSSLFRWKGLEIDLDYSQGFLLERDIKDLGGGRGEDVIYCT